MFKELIYEHGFLAVHYTEMLKKWSDADYYDRNVKRIQLPYSMAVVLTPDQQRDKRREMAKKLVEMNARKRDEKVIIFTFFLLINTWLKILNKFNFKMFV